MRTPMKMTYPRPGDGHEPGRFAGTLFDIVKDMIYQAIIGSLFPTRVGMNRPYGRGSH